MKFKTLAIAIAAATVSTAAMADGHMGAPEFKISGDVTVGFFDIGGEKSFGGNDSELNFNASQTVGGITYFGSMTAMVDDSIDGKNIRSDDMYVGFKGGFGEVRMGDTDNGCDAVDTGWVADDNFISHESGGCGAGDQNNITYKGSRGPVSYAVGYSPDVDAGSTVAGEDTVSVGIAGKVGPATVSLGYETAGDWDNTVLGVSGNFGPVAAGIRASKADGGDTDVGYTAQYSARGNKFYVGYGDINDDMNTLFLGYNRSIGSNTTFIAEYVNVDGATDDKYAVALKHAF
jgi:hypothetical protein